MPEAAPWRFAPGRARGVVRAGRREFTVIHRTSSRAVAFRHLHLLNSFMLGTTTCGAPGDGWTCSGCRHQYRGERYPMVGNLSRRLRLKLSTGGVVVDPRPTDPKGFDRCSGRHRERAPSPGRCGGRDREVGTRHQSAACQAFQVGPDCGAGNGTRGRGASFAPSARATWRTDLARGRASVRVPPSRVPENHGNEGESRVAATPELGGAGNRVTLDLVVALVLHPVVVFASRPGVSTIRSRPPCGCCFEHWSTTGGQQERTGKRRGAGLWP